MHRIRTCFLIFFVGLILVSCSGPQTISRDELRSDLLAAISLASEIDLSANQLQEDRVTPAFAEGHLDYLRKEALRTANELQKVRADERVSGVLENGRVQVDSLVTVLSGLVEKNRNKESLSAGRQQAAKIRTMLERAKDEL